MWQSPISSHLRVPTGDFVKKPIIIENADEQETCILVGVEVRRRSAAGASGTDSGGGCSSEESLEELAELAAGARAEVIGSVLQSRDALDPATVIGRGKAGEIRNWAAEVDADVVIFDHNLSPTQQRNLEKGLDRRVLDRTQLILDIFARHARTREGRLQVELAQLSYLLPRLTGRGVEMSRLGAGIGTRGPGETKLETDRRRIARRIEKLKADLETVRSTRKLQRKKRTAVPLATIALAGYTNAGKSTLFNALTSAKVVADKRMFATLDPTIRVLELPSRRKVLLSDTVGFISNLPTTLIQSFRATLEEVTEAAMLLHVVDISSDQRRERMREVAKVLEELDADKKPQILVLNKSDLLGAAEAEEITHIEKAAAGACEVLSISARRGGELTELLEAIDRRLEVDDLAVVQYHFSHEDGDKISFLYEHARVMERTDNPQGVEILAETPRSVRLRLSGEAVSGRDIMQGGSGAGV